MLCRYTLGTLSFIYPTGKLYGPLILYALSVHCTDPNYICLVDRPLLLYALQVYCTAN